MRGRLAVAFVLCVAARSFAQPAPEAGAPAARDFLAAYEITKDPVLFFKIGSAYEKAGKCPTAVGYYDRYLAEAKPEENFVTITKERIDAFERGVEAILKNAKASAADAPLFIGPVPIPKSRPPSAP